MGTGLLDGQDLFAMRPPQTAEAGVARTFQNLALFANLSVIDNLMLGRHHLMKAGPVAGAIWWGRARREEIVHRRRCAEIMDLLDLGVYRHHPVGVLPYGIQKRIELGRALAMDPRLLLLDEPVAGMNLEETEDMAGHISEVREELDVAIILVEHQMDLVMDLVDRLLVLAFGQVVATGSPSEIQGNQHVIEAYVGVETHDRARHSPARAASRHLARRGSARAAPAPRCEHAEQRARCATTSSRAGGRSPGRSTPTRTAHIGLGLSSLGVGPGDRVAIHSENRPEWVMTDLAAQGIGAATVGIYPTSPASEVQYLLGHSRAVVLITEDEEQLDKVLEVREHLPAPTSHRGDRHAAVCASTSATRT